MITNYITKDTNPITGEEDLISTFVNANSSYSYGAELTSVTNIKKWWDVTANVNLYKSKINTENLGPAIAGGNVELVWKINTNFKLPKNWTIQVSADYQSKTNLPVNKNTGQMGPPMQQAQASAQATSSLSGAWMLLSKRTFKNQAATVTFSISDIFEHVKMFSIHSEYF